MTRSAADIQAAFAHTLADEWARGGLTHAVVCPGSRSTPLALALADHPGVEVTCASTSARRPSLPSASVWPPAGRRWCSRPAVPPPPSCMPPSSRATGPRSRSSPAPPTAPPSCTTSGPARPSTRPICSAGPSAGSATRGWSTPVGAGCGDRSPPACSPSRPAAPGGRGRSISTSPSGSRCSVTRPGAAGRARAGPGEGRGTPRYRARPSRWMVPSPPWSKPGVWTATSAACSWPAGGAGSPPRCSSWPTPSAGPFSPIRVRASASTTRRWWGPPTASSGPRASPPPIVPMSSSIWGTAGSPGWSTDSSPRRSPAGRAPSPWTRSGGGPIPAGKCRPSSAPLLPPSAGRWSTASAGPDPGRPGRVPPAGGKRNGAGPRPGPRAPSTTCSAPAGVGSRGRCANPRWPAAWWPPCPVRPRWWSRHPCPSATWRPTPRPGCTRRGCWPTAGPTASTVWCPPPSEWRSPHQARRWRWSGTLPSSMTSRPWSVHPGSTPT